MMELRKIGDSDLHVSPVSLGGMSLKGGGNKTNSKLIKHAYEVGFNYFDTADLYEKGLNEIMLGEALQSFRKDVIIATKVGNRWNDDGNSWDWKASKSYILKEIDVSLSRLKTDYIDLYQLHGGMIEDPIDEIIEAFEILVKEGKIRYYGLSSIRPNVFLEYSDRSNIISNMMQYSLLDRRPEQYFDTLSSSEVSVISRGSIAQGFLVDKSAEEYLQYTSSEVLMIQKNVKRIALLYGVSPLSIALSYVLSHPEVATAVVGVRSQIQLNALIKSQKEIQQLSSDDIAELQHGVRDIHYTSHIERR